MRACLILNGKKADRVDVRQSVHAVRAAGHELDVRVTWEQGDAGRYAAEAAGEGVRRVIAGGGDGSLHEVAAGLMRVPVTARPELGIVPLGTANDFAAACGVPLAADAALTLALTGEARPIDLGRCNDRFFVNVASGGFGAAITADTPVDLKNFLGGGAYTLMGLAKAMHFVPYACSIRAPDGELAGKIIAGAICNGRQAGGGQPLAPAALLDDGLLDVVALQVFPPSAAPRVVAELLANEGRGEFVQRLRTPWLELTAPAAIPVNVDGEPASGRSFRFTCEPACLRVVLPTDCPCLGGQRGAAADP